jgi:hypothetical protein
MYPTLGTWPFEEMLENTSQSRLTQFIELSSSYFIVSESPFFLD